MEERIIAIFPIWATINHDPESYGVTTTFGGGGFSRFDIASNSISSSSGFDSSGRYTNEFDDSKNTIILDNNNIVFGKRDNHRNSNSNKNNSNNGSFEQAVSAAAVIKSPRHYSHPERQRQRQRQGQQHYEHVRHFPAPVPPSTNDACLNCGRSLSQMSVRHPLDSEQTRFCRNNTMPVKNMKYIPPPSISFATTSTSDIHSKDGTVVSKDSCNPATAEETEAMCSITKATEITQISQVNEAAAAVTTTAATSPSIWRQRTMVATDNITQRTAGQNNNGAKNVTADVTSGFLPNSTSTSTRAALSSSTSPMRTSGDFQRFQATETTTKKKTAAAAIMENEFVIECYGGERITVTREQAAQAKTNCNFYHITPKLCGDHNDDDGGTIASCSAATMDNDAVAAASVGAHVTETSATTSIAIAGANVTAARMTNKTKQQQIVLKKPEWPAETARQLIQLLTTGKTNIIISDNKNHIRNLIRISNQICVPITVRHPASYQDIKEDIDLIHEISKAWKQRKHQFHFKCQDTSTQVLDAYVWGKLLKQGIVFIDSVKKFSAELENGEDHNVNNNTNHNHTQRRPPTTYSVGCSAPLFVAVFHTCTLLHMNRLPMERRLSDPRPKNIVTLHVELYLGSCSAIQKKAQQLGIKIYNDVTHEGQEATWFVCPTSSSQETTETDAPTSSGATRPTTTTSKGRRGSLESLRILLEHTKPFIVPTRLTNIFCLLCVSNPDVWFLGKLIHSCQQKATNDSISSSSGSSSSSSSNNSGGPGVLIFNVEHNDYLVSRTFNDVLETLKNLSDPEGQVAGTGPFTMVATSQNFCRKF